jgi:hypothetical protein
MAWKLTIDSQNLEGRSNRHAGITPPRVEADIIKEEVLSGARGWYVE